MFSTFGPDTLAELRALYRELGWAAPAQAFVDMHDLGDMLVHAGFADPVMDQEHLTLHWPGPRELLAELRSLGGNLNPARHRGLRTPRWRSRLEAALRERADATAASRSASKSSTAMPSSRRLGCRLRRAPKCRWPICARWHGAAAVRRDACTLS